LFVPLPPPTDAEIERLALRVARRLTKRARLYLAGHADEHALQDPDDEETTLQHALSTALRPPVRPQRCLPLESDPEPPPPSPLCTRVAGYSLHAARAVATGDRAGLERLCRYGLRAPFAQSRMSLLPDGRVHYRLAKPWPTPAGVTELIMEPVQFLKRLAALLPAPYQNQTRYHGCFANRSRFRPRLPRPPAAKVDTTTGPEPELGREPELKLHIDGNEAPETRPRRLPWARLLKRTLGVDGLDCPHCSATMVVIALITRPSVITKILDHLRIPSTPPPVAPARPHPACAQADLSDCSQDSEVHPPDDLAQSAASAFARAPP
ncbi:MAG: hypothetical protein GY701_27125, partial [Sulfitobacter sp.]|nr:hypothetical protein [Sulfitobacter sp.]